MVSISNNSFQINFMDVKDLALVFFLSFSTLVQSAEPFEFPVSRIAIKPMQNGSFENYIGKGANFELTFVTPNQKKPITSFPEPPFYIHNLVTEQSCKGGEKGGIWEKNSVYVTKNARLLILGSYSGSNKALEFYDIKTCEQIYWLADSISKNSLFVNEKRILFPNGVPTKLKKYLGVNSD